MVRLCGDSETLPLLSVRPRELLDTTGVPVNERFEEVRIVLETRVSCEGDKLVLDSKFSPEELSVVLELMVSVVGDKLVLEL
jgi:hypothetical protein